MWLNKYEGGDGKTHSALSITQSECHHPALDSRLNADLMFF